VVLSAQEAASPAAHDALEQLCRVYWYPLYAYVRRQGHSPHDAQDLTQEFFARFIAKNYLDAVRRERGKFRSFLLAALKHFLANEWDRARARKRGGAHTIIALDEHDAEARYALEPRDESSADKIYERRWALTLLEQVLGRLREEYAAAGKAGLFDGLKSCLTEKKSSTPHAALATRLGMTEEAVKVAVHRLRKRYRDRLRSEIAHTVATPDEVDEEIRHLFTALGG